MKYRLFKALIVMMTFGTLLGACSTTPTILGGCPIPQQLDVHKDGPADLKAVDPAGHIAEEAAQRHQHKQDANDFNALHDFVATNCK